ncbi:MAG: response regulator transcription factor [Defluviitaleaceae bacterium]|nr:response regulator transcription factor [Defluviitaleaceae bacterium]
MKLLIVEDKESLQRALYKGFHKLEYTVDTASDGDEALELFYSNTYDLIVLDINLPKLSGMEVLKEIRADNKDVPVLILSARSKITDKIAGLDEGANDYLAKPFHFAELEARARALLRRNFKTSGTIITVGDVRMDTALKKLFVYGAEISLAKKEYAIIEYLLLHRGETITPSELIEHIWESDSEDVFNSLKVHLSTLRKKFPDSFIKNARGHGYYVE